MRVPLELCSASVAQETRKPAGDALEVGSGRLVHHRQHPVLHGISVAGATEASSVRFCKKSSKAYDLLPLRGASE